MLDVPPDSPAMSTGPVTAEFLSAWCRLLDLLSNPEDIPFLSGLIEREIMYRILRGPEGARLRAIATLGDQSHRTAKAIAWIKANYARPLRVEELAQVAGMAVSTLHHHFRALTAMSPLQYQKQIRLQAARARMLADDVDAATVAFEVGYESASQFNREYSRLFGQPPIRDVRNLRSPSAPRARISRHGLAKCLNEELVAGIQLGNRRSGWMVAIRKMATGESLGLRSQGFCNDAERRLSGCTGALQNSIALPWGMAIRLGNRPFLGSPPPDWGDNSVLLPGFPARIAVCRSRRAQAPSAAKIRRSILTTKACSNIFAAFRMRAPRTSNLSASCACKVKTVTRWKTRSIA